VSQDAPDLGPATDVDADDRPGTADVAGCETDEVTMATPDELGGTGGQQSGGAG